MSAPVSVPLSALVWELGSALLLAPQSEPALVPRWTAVSAWASAKLTQELRESAAELPWGQARKAHWLPQARSGRAHLRAREAPGMLPCCLLRGSVPTGQRWELFLWGRRPESDLERFLFRRKPRWEE